MTVPKQPAPIQTSTSQPSSGKLPRNPSTSQNKRAVDSQSLTKEAHASDFIDTHDSDLANQNLAAQKPLKGFTKPEDAVGDATAPAAGSAFDDELFDASAFSNLASDADTLAGEFADSALDSSTTPFSESTSVSPAASMAAPEIGESENIDSASAVGNTADESLPDNSWDSSNSRKNRSLILAIVIGVGGLILAGLVFAVFVSISNQPNVANNDSSSESPEGKNTNQNSEQNSGGASEIQDNKIANPDAGPDRDLDAPGELNSTDQTSKSPAEVKSMAEILAGTSGDANKTIDSSSSETSSDTTNQLPNNGDDDQSSAQSSAALDALDPLAELTAAVEDNKQTERNSKLLSDFESIFNPSSAGLLSDVGSENENDVVRPPIVDIGASVHPPAIQPQPIADVLNRRIVAIQTEPIPLAVAVRTLCGLGNVGITVDLFALKAAQIPFDVKIQLAARDITFDELLSQSLAPANLVIVNNADDFLTITAKEETLQESVPSIYELADLISDDATSEQWQQFLFDAFQIDEGTLSVSENAIEFTDTLNATDRYKILSQIDRIREMSGGSKVLPHSLANSNPWDMRLLLDKSSKPSDEIITHDRPIASILGQMAQQNDVSLWVDWRHTMPHGLSPSTMSTSLLRNRTLGDVAFSFLDKYSLELLAIDNDNLILSTAIARRTSPTWLVVPVAPTDDLTKIKLEFADFAPIDSKYQSQLWIGKVPGQNAAILRLCWPDLSQVSGIPDIVRE